jgi:DNA-binding cell septation regulator SpoVG
MKISEIQITPIKPKNGLVAFASCVIDDWLYLGSIGIMTRLSGGYRLTYPTKNVGNTSLNIYHPIDKRSGEELSEVIIVSYEEVMRKSNDRYRSSHP